MSIIKVKKEDTLKSIYFIIKLTQDQGHAMYGTLAGKSDLMGGIFDRWINVIPESIIFNKHILPSIANGKKVEVISDYYRYDPTVAGIAPDVIGIRVDDKVIPFVQYNEHWQAVEGMPQIEIKTFKKPQKMISLRNQGYDEKYLIMIESEFRIDYLLPFFEKELLSETIYQEMMMDDKHFIVSNVNGGVHQMTPIENESDELGEIKLLTVTRSDEFMKVATCCEGRVSVQRLATIEEYTSNRIKDLINEPLSNYCDLTEFGLYRFNANWYDGIDEDGVPYRNIKNKSGTIHHQKLRTLDFSSSSIKDIVILKKNKDCIYIRATADVLLNEVLLEKDKMYKLTYSVLERDSNDNPEYFMQKDLINYIPNLEKELKNRLEKIIKNN